MRNAISLRVCPVRTLNKGIRKQSLRAFCIGVAYLAAVSSSVGAQEVPPAHREPSELHLQGGPVMSLPIIGRIWQASAAASSEDPDALVMCTFETDTAHGRESSVAYVSLDAGNTWLRTLVARDSDWVSEASCAYGGSGRAYFVASASDTSRGGLDHQRGAAEVFRSRDNGLTWSEPEHYPFIDWTSLLVVSNSETEKVYLFGNNLAKGFGGRGNGEWLNRHGSMSVSEDGSGFGLPVSPTDSKETDKFGLFPVGAVALHDGAILALFAKLTVPRSGSEYVLYKADKDGYRLFSKIPLPGALTHSATLGAQMAIDRSGRFPGRLYVAFSNEQNGRSALVLASSDDGGGHWSTKVLLEGKPLSEVGVLRAGFAGVAVNGEGLVGIEWAASNDCPIFAVSADGGETLKEVLPLGSCQDPAADETQPNYAQNQFWPLVGRQGFSLMMHPNLSGALNLVADKAGRFHPFWMEISREGKLALQTAVISLQSGPSRERRPLDLAMLTDLTKNTIVRVLSEEFDPLTATFDLDVAVENSSRLSNLAYPSILEIAETSSGCGKATLLNPSFAADNGNSLMRVPKQNGRIELSPGERTLPVHLRVQVPGCENDRGQLVGLSRRGLQEFRSEFMPLRMQFQVLASKPN